MRNHRAEFSAVLSCRDLGPKRPTRVISQVVSVAMAASLLASYSPKAVAQAEPESLNGFGSSRLSTRIDAPTEKKRVKLGWRLGLGGESFANEKEQTQTAGFSLDGDLKYLLASSLELRARAGIQLQSGYAQSRFGDNAPKSGVNLVEAVMQYKPFSRIALQAGAIDQAHLGSPLLVSQRPFPGVLEKVLIGTKEYNAELRAQQTIPTSTTLSTKSVEAEVTPYFLSESLILKLRPIDEAQLKVFGTHFAFRNLPSTVATESEIHGNTIEESGPNTSRFAFEFDGWVLGSEARLQMHRSLAAKIDGQMLQNTKAKESYSQAQSLGAGLEISLPGEVDIAPHFETFFAESDVAPAFYNSAELGHNNRHGWAADLSSTFKSSGKSSGFKIAARYADADTINPSLVQSRQSYFMVRFETLYEFL